MKFEIVLVKFIIIIAECIDQQDDVFKLVKAKEEEVWETYILIGCAPILKKASQLFQAVKRTLLELLNMFFFVFS